MSEPSDSFKTGMQTRRAVLGASYVAPPSPTPIRSTPNSRP